MFSKLTKRQWTLIFLTILFLLIFFFILPVALPLILAILTALFLNPVVRFVRFRFRFNRKISVIAVFIVFLLVISTIGTYVTTKSVAQLVKLAENAPDYINNITLLINDLESDMNTFTQGMPSDFVEEVSATIQSNLGGFREQISKTVTIENIAGIVAKVPEFLVSFIVYLIALCLFMLELPRLKQKAYDLMTETTAEKVSFMNARFAYVIIGFFKAQFLVSIIIFFVSLIGLWYIAPEVAIIMSIIIWIIDFIPIIGSIAILGPWSVYMFLAGDVAMGAKLGILAIILLAIRRTVEPKVMGRHIGLSPLVTLIAMYLGLKLLGILGFIIGPLIVIAYNSAKEAGIIKWKLKI
ncbi:sporulation integral membrane protein YtvI [Salinibacillus xinjiangensis]|uniref:Sporulation integral membrane protein YtvI n=1 Tax=Salinibacillus xinjiangensis TaxID=1229268 RepID=A0A6G1X3N9_9BACI|nr:sporulation integral membrane protein YtvI [Salinibacillus xinjiangensis]MRG85525.1 sporulation integral membrane protein YtvI [Salinibacillus xinjiangensis]